MPNRRTFDHIGNFNFKIEMASRPEHSATWKALILKRK